MNNFKKPGKSRIGGRPGMRPKFGAATRFGGPRREGFQKFDAACSNCGKACQVPFRPDGEKPVYCKDCFGAPREALSSKRKGFSAEAAGPIGRAPAKNGDKSIADLTRQIAAMNAKIDTMLKILEGGPEER